MKEISVNRKEELAQFYKISIQDIDYISSFKHKSKERTSLLHKYGIDKDIFRAMIDYNRYNEASKILEYINIDKDKEKIKVLDFGCLVSDYGIYFAKLGYDVTICDKSKDFLDFSNFRFKIHKKSCTPLIIKKYEICKYIFKDIDIIIFGEVLEHLDNPIQLINYSVENKIKYIFTSRYPFGDENYYSLPGHKKLAEQQQKECISVLNQNNYKAYEFLNKINLWERQY